MWYLHEVNFTVISGAAFVHSHTPLYNFKFTNIIYLSIIHANFFLCLLNTLKRSKSNISAQKLRVNWHEVDTKDSL